MTQPTSQQRRVPGWLIAVVVTPVLLGLIALVSVPAARQYAEHASAFCTNCHASEHERPGHQETACQACHAVPEDESLGLIATYLLRPDGMPVHGEAADQECIACHQRDGEAWRELLQTDGHAAHSAEPAIVECVRCHGASLHASPNEAARSRVLRTTSPVVGEESCVSCHEDSLVQGSSAASLQCAACHFFVTQPAEGEAPAPGTERTVGITEVHGAAECANCHNPHIEAPAQIVCTSCHQGLEQQLAEGPAGHLGPDGESGRGCAGCHQPHASRDELAGACIGCHALPGEGRQDSPRGPDRTWRASTVANPPSPERTRLAEAMHHQGACPTCHQPHRWSVGEGCPECHEEQHEGLAAMPADSHTQCVGCHEPHHPPPTAQTCGTCHEQNARAQRGLRGDHQDCLSCHTEPHQERPTFLSACPTCHTNVQRTLSAGQTRHQDCSACHTAHGDPTRGTAAACGNCHQANARSLARAGVPTQHRNCPSCHTPHRFEPAAALNACARCHAQQASATASHNQDPCTTCHDQHAPPLARASTCATCHQDVHPTVARHQRCQSCHRPHTPAAGALAQCGDCHQTQVRNSASWPSGSPHAGRCSECHSRHNERQQQETCAGCHAAQNNVRHHGNHPASCSGCHPVHEQRRTGPTGWWGSCASCHNAQARGVAAARTSTHRRCQACHQTPGPPLPRCESCHDDMQTHLLHSQREHRECSRCHETHGQAPPGRRQCLSCHQDRAAHYSDAPQCQSCHPFAED